MQGNNNAGMSKISWRPRDRRYKDMTLEDTLAEIRKRAENDPLFLEAILETANDTYPLSSFCRFATEQGLPLYEMDLIDAGEAAYAAMKRSTNGGGENSPALEYQEDYYAMFMEDLRAIQKRKRTE